MKSLGLVVLLLVLAGCAGSGSGTSTQAHGCNMSYSCNGNVSCINDMHAYNGSGTFQTEQDCLVWETGFLNSFGNPRDSVSACSCY